MTEDAILHFQQRARAYLRKTGQWDADVLQEMVCLALAYTGDHALDMNNLYLQAQDRLDPRRQQKGVRYRQSQRTVALPETCEPGAPESPPCLIDLPTTGSLRAMLLLYSAYGCTMAEIGTLFGLSESRISQMFTAYRAAQVFQELPPADGLTWEVTWLTI